MGCWLTTLLVGDKSREAEYRQRLPDNDPPVMQAEFMVVRVVFESLVRMCFADADDASTVHRFVGRLLSYPGVAKQLNAIDTTAVVRAALSTRPVPYRGFDLDRLLVIQSVVARTLVLEHRLDDALIRKMVVEAERQTAERKIALAPAHPACGATET